MKKSSTTNRRSNDLLDDTYENIIKNLVGKIVRSKQDPFKQFVHDKADEEKTVGLIVKVEKKVSTRSSNLSDMFRQRRTEYVWIFHILIDESVEVIAYVDLNKFTDHWDVLES